MNILQADGKLADWYRPASYCDTSFLIELEDSFNQYLATFGGWVYNNAEVDLVRKYCRKTSNRSTQLLGISRRLFEEESLHLVYSPLCTIEYMEAITKEGMLDTLSSVLGAKAIQRISSKELGKISKAMYDDYLKDSESNEDPRSPWWNLGLRLFDPLPDSYGGELPVLGATLINIMNLSLTDPDKIEKMLVLSKFQIGMVDIMHLLVAEHIGCSNFLTFDQDFNRAKEEIQNLFGLRVIDNVNEIAATI